MFVPGPGLVSNMSTFTLHFVKATKTYLWHSYESYMLLTCCAKKNKCLLSLGSYQGFSIFYCNMSPMQCVKAVKKIIKKRQFGHMSEDVQNWQMDLSETEILLNRIP